MPEAQTKTPSTLPDASIPDASIPDAISDARAPVEPFPGLRPFETRESDWYFGRDKETYELLQQLRVTQFVAVTGPSGCGKSSLVKAGLIANLRDGYMANGAEWRIASMRPGDAPLRNLAGALAECLQSGKVAAQVDKDLRHGPQSLIETVQSAGLPPRTKVLVLVDQFEEVFQFVARSGERAAREEAKQLFNLLIAGSASPNVAIYIVITMRLEYLAQCAEYQGLTEAINEGLYLVPHLTRNQYSESIVGPIRQIGGAISPALLDRLLNDVNETSDPLPLLQHALRRMWEIRGSKNSLDLDDYRGIQGLSECLSDHAEKVYTKLDEKQKIIAEVLFRSITEVSPERRKVRKPQKLAAIAERAQVPVAQAAEVVEAFRQRGRAFLTSPDTVLTADSLIDLSHEALIRQWATLRGWVDDEARVARAQRQLEDAADQWREQGKPNSFLFRGGQLAWVEDFVVRRLPLTPLQSEFIRASRKQERRKYFKRFGWAAGAVVVVLFGLFSYVLYWNQKLQLARSSLETQLSFQQLHRARNVPAPDNELVKKQALEAKRQLQAVLGRTLGKGITIQYFTKTPDSEMNEALSRTWKKLGFTVRFMPTNLEQPPNACWYGSKVSLDAARAIAYSMIENGVAVRELGSIKETDQSNVVQIGWKGAAVNQPVMTLDDVKNWKPAGAAGLP